MFIKKLIILNQYDMIYVLLDEDIEEDISQS